MRLHHAMKGQLLRVNAMIMQIVNTSSTLGSIGNREPLLANDEARRGNAFAWGAVAYNMSKAAMNMREPPDSSSSSI